jgi:pimeloyl-ACP methyl ester carboxylesterase
MSQLKARNGDVTLAGALWLPAGEPAATVLMYPGSGPSDRDNDVFFPPIRKHLLAAGIAVSSFDKRGVGGSTGRWQEAAIVEQASDAICCLELLQRDVGGRVGLFGHSQGGWVVIEAAARFPQAAFVISSSGPGVTPEQQERYATQLHMKRAGIADEELDEVRRYYDDIVAMMRAGVSLADARRRVEEGGFPQAFATLDLPVLPDDEAEWKLAAALMDYDPRPALERIRVPTLAVFGGDDPITPVEESVAVFREAVPAGLLHVEVFADAGHRLEAGNPPRLAEGYLETLTAFVLGDWPEFRNDP